jgi:hypothetical protein
MALAESVAEVVEEAQGRDQDVRGGREEEPGGLGGSVTVAVGIDRRVVVGRTGEGMGRRDQRQQQRQRSQRVPGTTGAAYQARRRRLASATKAICFGSRGGGIPS